MKLSEAVSNPVLIKAVLGTDPSLKQIDLFEIIFDRDGPTVCFRFDIQEFPSSPPEKWNKAGYNRAQLTLSCIGVREITQQGWGTHNVADLTIEDGGSAKIVRVEGNTIKLRLVSDFLNVDKISAYRSGE